ncbi:MAG: NUDIX hydrolase [Acidimicrobiales bacterium]
MSGDGPRDAAPHGEVRAAGGVVWRRDPAPPHRLEVALVHRPRYDDWSLPKGKLEPGEDDAAAAQREVAEEAGVEGRVGGPLGEVAYRDRKGRPKRVRFFSIEALRVHEREPDEEVDEVRWVSPAGARAELSYASDREILAAFEAGLERRRG